MNKNYNNGVREKKEVIQNEEQKLRGYLVIVLFNSRIKMWSRSCARRRRARAIWLTLIMQ